MKKIIKITEQDITNIVRRVLMEQSNLHDVIQNRFTQYSTNPDSFKHGIIDSDDKLNEFVNWYQRSEKVAIDILNNLNIKTITDRFDEKEAPSNIINLIHTITEDLSALSKLPPKYVNVQNIEHRLRSGELGGNIKDFKITERYNNYHEVLFEIYQQQLKVIGR
jgi:hypothetical protein